MAVNRLMSGADLARAVGLDASKISKIAVEADRGIVRVRTEAVLQEGEVEPLLSEYVLVKAEDGRSSDEPADQPAQARHVEGWAE